MVSHWSNINLSILKLEVQTLVLMIHFFNFFFYIGLPRDDDGKLKDMEERSRTAIEAKEKCFVDEYDKYSTAPETGSDTSIHVKKILNHQFHVYFHQISARRCIANIVICASQNNGNLTKSSNMYDSAALKVAYDLYKKETKGKLESRLPNFNSYTMDQLFFISFGHVSKKKCFPSIIKHCLIFYRMILNYVITSFFLHRYGVKA